MTDKHVHTDLVQASLLREDRNVPVRCGVCFAARLALCRVDRRSNCGRTRHLAGLLKRLLEMDWVGNSVRRLFGFGEWRRGSKGRRLASLGLLRRNALLGAALGAAAQKAGARGNLRQNVGGPPGPPDSMTRQSVLHNREYVPAPYCPPWLAPKLWQGKKVGRK